jgi:hypothetical protein
MFCSGCGQPLTPGQAFCAQCGRPLAAVVPPVPGLQYQLESYAGKVRLLSIFWFIYAGISLLLAFAGLSFAHAIMSGSFGPWMHGPMPPNFLGPAFLHFIWIILTVRVALTVAAAWGLLQHEQWGRILAIVVAILSLIHFPLGTALGIWTLIMLLGYQNGSLYEQL